MAVGVKNSSNYQYFLQKIWSNAIDFLKHLWNFNCINLIKDFIDLCNNNQWNFKFKVIAIIILAHWYSTTTLIFINFIIIPEAFCNIINFKLQMDYDHSLLVLSYHYYF